MASMILGAALLVLAAFLVSRHPSPVVAPPPVSTVVKDANDAPLAIVAPATNELDLGEFMRVAEPLAKTFLEAQTLTDLLAVVRHPQLTRQRFIARFHDENLQPLGLQTFAEDGAVRIDQSSATVKIRTGNFEQRDLSFAHTKAGWKIDWESWVGWCDVPWDEFNEKALTTPNRFRVHLKPITYYNFSFSDDRKWRSYLIESPDGEHRFFGYVERGSPLDDRINFADNSTDQDFILDLCFPSDHSGQNQLLISDLIAEGWIEPEPTDSP